MIQATEHIRERRETREGEYGKRTQIQGSLLRRDIRDVDDGRTVGRYQLPPRKGTANGEWR